MHVIPPGYRSKGERITALGGVLCRVQRESDGREYLARSCAEEFPAEDEIRCFDAELEAVHLPTNDAILRPVERIDGHRNSWLLYQAPKGAPLSLERPCTLEQFWGVAVPLVCALRDCHQTTRIHARLEPGCIWWEPQSGQITLVGALPATSKYLSIGLRTSIYTAPELFSGARAQATVAADIYSLGVILHRMLSGPPPCDIPDRTLLDLVGHPLPPLVLPEPLQGLALLVETMLAKDPTMRPANATQVLQEMLAIQAGADSSRSEVSFRLREPIGRDEELGRLAQAVSHAAGDMRSVILLEGEPGIGKSFLLQQLKQQPVARASAIAEAKFDQFRQERPYSALLDALRSVLEHALADADVGFARLQSRLESGNRHMLGVLRSELPELELLSGWLPVPPRLGPSETLNRYKLAFRALLDLMCDPAAPLILILDDMQWADSATSDLLGELIGSGLPMHLSLVLSYRPDESKENERFVAVLARTREATHIRLAPLSYEQTSSLCAAVFPGCQNLQALTSSVHGVCFGNPLHSLEVLKRMLACDAVVATEEGWNFNASATSLPTSRLDASDTVVGLITSRIMAAPAPLQDLLKTAACAGQRFSAQLLGVAFGDDPKAAAPLMRTAVKEGLLTLVPQSDGEYSFAHDRVQQAAFALGDGRFHQEVHLRLGRHYRTAAKDSQQCLFTCVEHLGQAHTLLDTQEATELTELTLLAARRAKESIAYRRAIKLLGPLVEQTTLSQSDAFEAKLMFAECHYLSLQFTQAELLLKQCWLSTCCPEQQVRVLRTRLSLYQHNQRYADSVQVALQALTLLGYRLPERPTPPRLIAGLVALLARTHSIQTQTLASRTNEATPEQQEILDFLSLLWGPSFWTNQNLNGLVVIQLMKLTLRYGNSPNAPFAYVCFAVLNYVLFKRYEVALDYSRLALTLADSSSPFIRLRVQFLAFTFFGAFERTHSENVTRYEQALQECLATGEHLAAHLLDGIITTLPALENGVPRLMESLAKYRLTSQSAGADSTLELIEIVKRWGYSLVDGPDTPETTLDIPVSFESYSGVRDLLRMQTAYLWDDDQLVLSLATRLRKDPVIQGNPLHTCMHALYHLLALCRKQHKPGHAGRQSLKILERLAGINPQNFGCQFLLAKAELNATLGNFATAAEEFHQAMAESAEHGHQLLGALCAERFAAHCETREDGKQHAEYMRVAGFAYSRFGARAKLGHLMRKYPAVNWRPSVSQTPNMGGLQLEAVMKAASTIAQETSSDQLAPTLLRVIATAAGAQRALLLVRHTDGWRLQAGWDPDRGSIIPQPRLLAETGNRLPVTIVRYVARTKKVVQLPDAHARFADDPYLSANSPRALLCVPLLHGGTLNSILYLENSLFTDVFSPDQRQLVTLLGNHAAIALSNLDHHRLQMEAIQAKVNPHFLYNALSVIAELVATEPHRAEEAVFGLARLYRYILNSCVDDKVPLERELAIVRDYLELERARFGPRLRVEWDVDDSTAAVNVPALLLQPLAENAVNHGIRRNIEGGVVRVSARVQGNQLLLSVADDGPGWYQGQGGNGFGVRSIEQRLQLLYGDQAHLRFEKGSGVTATISLPF